MSDNQLASSYIPFFIIFYGIYLSIFFFITSLIIIAFTLPNGVETYLHASLFFISLLYQFYIWMNDKHYTGVYHWRNLRKHPFLDTVSNYFSIKCVIDDIDNYSEKCPKPNQIEKCIFALHPHGVFCFPLLHMLKLKGQFSKLYSKVKTCGLVSSLVCYTPLLREISQWLGCVEATHDSAKNVIKKGFSPIIMPGGVKELMMTSPDKEYSVIKNRKGFIEVAIVNGVPVIPVYAFGLNKTYKTSNLFQKLRIWLSHNLFISIPLFWGKYGSCIPFQSKITLVFGKPIYFPQKDKPSKQFIDDFHQIYVEELESLYNKYKDIYGTGEELELI